MLQAWNQLCDASRKPITLVYGEQDCSTDSETVVTVGHKSTVFGPQPSVYDLRMYVGPALTADQVGSLVLFVGALLDPSSDVCWVFYDCLNQADSKSGS